MLVSFSRIELTNKVGTVEVSPADYFGDSMAFDLTDLPIGCLMTNAIARKPPFIANV